MVQAGRKRIKKKDEILNGRCDSFVVETDVHYPTFTTLLFDAIRTIILLITKVCKKLKFEDCNDHIGQIKEIKNSLHRLQRLQTLPQKMKRNRFNRNKLLLMPINLTWNL